MIYSRIFILIWRSRISWIVFCDLFGHIVLKVSSGFSAEQVALALIAFKGKALQIFTNTDEGVGMRRSGSEGPFSWRNKGTSYWWIFSIIWIWWNFSQSGAIVKSRSHAFEFRCQEFDLWRQSFHCCQITKFVSFHERWQGVGRSPRTWNCFCSSVWEFVFYHPLDSLRQWIYICSTWIRPVAVCPLELREFPFQKPTWRWVEFLSKNTHVCACERERGREREKGRGTN